MDAAIPALPNSRPPLQAEMQEIRRVAEEFEAMVLAELLQPVFAQMDTDGLGGGGDGEQMFRPMLVQQYAQSMARAGGIGLADSVIREMTRLQAGPQPAPEPRGPIPLARNEDSDGADR